MQTIAIPTKTYKTLLQKARAFDRVLDLTKLAFPLDEYSADDILEFKRADSVNARQKREILSIIKTKSRAKI